MPQVVRIDIDVLLDKDHFTKTVKGDALPPEIKEPADVIPDDLLNRLREQEAKISVSVTTEHNPQYLENIRMSCYHSDVSRMIFPIVNRAIPNARKFQPERLISYEDMLVQLELIAG